MKLRTKEAKLKRTLRFLRAGRKWAVAGCLFAGVTLTVAVTPQDAAAAQQETGRPNVVLMLSDNVGYGDIGAFQGGAIRGVPTPNIDRLAAAGLTTHSTRRVV